MSLSLWHNSKSLVKILRASLLLFSFFLQTLYYKLQNNHTIDNKVHVKVVSCQDIPPE